jgi:hypothetical protein
MLDWFHSSTISEYASLNINILVISHSIIPSNGLGTFIKIALVSSFFILLDNGPHSYTWLTVLFYFCSVRSVYNWMTSSDINIAVTLLKVWLKFVSDLSRSGSK